MEPGAIRLILNEKDPRGSVRTAAYNETWRLHRIVPKTESDFYETIWEVDGADTWVHYTEDDITDLAYVTVLGPQASQVADAIRHRVHAYALDEILEYARKAKTRDEWIWAVYLVGVAAPAEYDPRFKEVIERALENEDRDVRRAALVAIGYAEWKQFRPLVERVKANDPDPVVRDDARIALEGLEQVWRQRSA